VDVLVCINTQTETSVFYLNNIHQVYSSCRSSYFLLASGSIDIFVLWNSWNFITFSPFFIYVPQNIIKPSQKIWFFMTSSPSLWISQNLIWIIGTFSAGTNINFLSLIYC